MIQERLADVLRRVRKKAKELGHGPLRRDNFGPEAERLQCETCGSTCWIRLYGEVFAEEPKDYSLIATRCEE